LNAAALSDQLMTETLSVGTRRVPVPTPLVTQDWVAHGVSWSLTISRKEQPWLLGYDAVSAAGIWLG
jgi:hypothetical protein